MAGSIPARSSIVEILKQACIEVGSLASSIEGTRISKKRIGRGAGGDISTLLDVRAENVAINSIRSQGLNPTIIAEEAGMIHPRNHANKPDDHNDGYLIIDAIDGTVNAHRGMPFYCCSLAYAKDFKLSRVTDAAIIDLVRGDLYWASKGRGAFLGKKKIKSAGKFESVIGLSMSSLDPATTARLAPVISQAKHVRQLGAVALELCFLARGIFDAYIDLRDKVRPTDLAAGYLIAKEAGAKLLSPSGKALDASLGINEGISFLACSKKAIDEFADKLFTNQTATSNE